MRPSSKMCSTSSSLRRRRNYIAPDELKDNILRGKSGLAITGGPKKNERVDEFKESILKKKEQMRAGITPSAITRQISAGEAPRKPEIPEAIAKRRGMTTASTASSTSSPSMTSPSTASKSRVDAGMDKSTFTEEPKALLLEKKVSAPGRLQVETSSQQTCKSIQSRSC